MATVPMEQHGDTCGQLRAQPARACECSGFDLRGHRCPELRDVHLRCSTWSPFSGIKRLEGELYTTLCH